MEGPHETVDNEKDARLGRKSRDEGRGEGDDLPRSPRMAIENAILRGESIPECQ